MAVRQYRCVVCERLFEWSQPGRPPTTCSAECRVAATKRYHKERHEALYVPRPRPERHCLVEGCPKPVHTLGYCGAHAALFKKYGTADLPEILCMDCGKPSGKQGRRRMRCRACSDLHKAAVQAERHRRRRAKDPKGNAERRQKDRLAHYGLTAEQFADMYARQGGLCAICVKPLDVDSSETHIDHCHTSSAVRALLCRACNLSIGCFKDDPELMRAAADYVEAHLIIT